MQFPDVMVTVDSLTRFSWMLLQRTPHDVNELLTLYAALVAHGTELEATDVLRMIPASSDMMSLEANRHLWNARVDPRRRTYAVGTYTHVLDQWGIVYDQPIVLNRRQAGAAIEGAIRQDVVDLRTTRGGYAWLYGFRHGRREVAGA
ncbi:MAG: hypothetical protein NVSMB52_16210 [Chloroflexota bacterium]